MGNDTHTTILGSIICALVIAICALVVFQHLEWFIEPIPM
jgi:hypothetical protein